jgi:hypothetical protein
LLLALLGFIAASCADSVAPVPRGRPRADGMPFPSPCTATSDDCICDSQGNCCRRDAWCVVGGDTVIVLPLPDTLLLTADSVLVSPGSPVTFTASSASGASVNPQS